MPIDSVQVEKLVDASIKMASASKYDVLFIFVVLASTAVTFTIVWFLLNRISKDYETLEKFSSSSLSNIFNTISEEFKSMNKSCKNHNDASTALLNKGISELGREQSRLYNTLVSLISSKDTVHCSVDLAVNIFDTVMKLHCFDKAIILIDELEKATIGTRIKDITERLSIKYRKITEEEKALLSNFVYENMHNLGSVFNSILEHDNWNNFINGKVTELVVLNRNNRNSLDVIESVSRLFDEIINDMRNAILKNGGKGE